MTKTLMLTALLTALAGAASAQTSWTWSNNAGASGGGTRDCSAADGARSCSTDRSATGAYGRTREVETDRVTQFGQSTVTGTRTGSQGGSAAFTRTWSR